MNLGQFFYPRKRSSEYNEIHGNGNYSALENNPLNNNQRGDPIKYYSSTNSTNNLRIFTSDYFQMYSNIR